MFKHLLSLLLLDEPLKTTYMPLGQTANSSAFSLKNLFRALGFIFALIATVANGVDAFNIALLNVFGGMGPGFLLYALCGLIALTVSLLYIWQEGRSIFKGTAKLPSLFAKWKVKPAAAPKAQAPISISEKWRYGLFRFSTAFIVFVTSIFWSASVFAGVVALMTLSAASGDAISIFTIFTGALGSVAPYVLALASLASISQFASCFFQEGTNFMKRVEKDLAWLLKINHIVFHSTSDAKSEAAINPEKHLDDASSMRSETAPNVSSAAGAALPKGAMWRTEHHTVRPLALDNAASAVKAEISPTITPAAHTASALPADSVHPVQSAWMVVRTAGLALAPGKEDELVPVLRS